MKRPPTISSSEFAKFKSTALNYLLVDGILYQRWRTNLPPSRVIPTINRQKQLNDTGGLQCIVIYKSGTRPARSVSTGLMFDMMSQCIQFLFLSWRTVGLNITYMPETVEGYEYLVILGEYLSGWVEARPLRDCTSLEVAQFVHEDVICRFGIPYTLVVDGGTENKGELQDLTNHFDIYRLQIVPYHPGSNGVVERGHQPIVDALSKLTECSGEPAKRWIEHLLSVFWGDQTAVKHSTGFALYRLIFGADCVLPIESTNPTWNVSHWTDITSTSDLLAIRARQLESCSDDIADAAKAFQERDAAKRRHDSTLRSRLIESNLVQEILSFCMIPVLKIFIMLSFYIEGLGHFKLYLTDGIVALMNSLNLMAPCYVATRINLV
jgi:hypothetical protein